MHLVTVVVRAAKQRSSKGMKFPPSHWSVVSQNSRTAKISSWKVSFEVFLMPLSLARAKQASELCSVPKGTPRRWPNQNSIKDSTQPRAARGQILELRNTGLSHYKYLWKSDPGGREQEQVVRGPRRHITSLEQSLWGHEPCVQYSKSTFTQRQDNLMHLSLTLSFGLYLHKHLAWFFYTISCGCLC